MPNPVKPASVAAATRSRTGTGPRSSGPIASQAPAVVQHAAIRSVPDTCSAPVLVGSEEGQQRAEHVLGALLHHEVAAALDGYAFHDVADRAHVVQCQVAARLAA